jgi:hypothetical protein
VVVAVPDKLTFDFHRLDMAVVEFANDARIPVILEFREFFREAYGLHLAPYNS